MHGRSLMPLGGRLDDKRAFRPSYRPGRPGPTCRVRERRAASHPSPSARVLALQAERVDAGGQDPAAACHTGARGEVGTWAAAGCGGEASRRETHLEMRAMSTQQRRRVASARPRQCTIKLARGEQSHVRPAACGWLEGQQHRPSAHPADAANQGRVGAPTAWPFDTRSSRPHSANRRACGGRGAAPPLRRVRAPTRA